MRFLFNPVMIFLGLSVPAFAGTTPDLVLQTRLSEESLSWLINKTRVILNDTHLPDGLAGTVKFSTPTEFTLENLSTDERYQKFMSMFAGLFHIDTTAAKLQLVIPEISYKIDTIYAKPLDLGVKDPILNLKAQAMLSGVYVELPKGLTVNLILPDQRTKEPKAFLTATIDAISILIPPSAPPVVFDVNFQTIRDREFTFKLVDSNFDQLPIYVRANQDKFVLTDTEKHSTLSADSIHVAPITLELGSDLTRTFEFETFKPVLQANFHKLIASILGLLGDSIKESLGKTILTSVFSSKIQSGLEASTADLYALYNTSHFSQPDSSQLSLEIDGTLCTGKNFKDFHEECVKHEDPIEPVRAIEDADHQGGLDEIKLNLAAGKEDVAVSVSEEYLNRLLKTTIDAGLWDENMKKNHLGIGPRGAFIILKEKTKTPELFMDVLYTGEGGALESIIVSPRHPLRFPLRISAGLNFIEKNGIPYLVIKTDKVLSDQEEIIDGIPEYGLPSHLIFALKKKIARLILEQAQGIEGQTALEMDLPMFKDVGLEHSTYEVSPHGRINLYFKSDGIKF